MAVAAISRNMVKACKLFLERKYEEAEKTMEKVKDPAYITAALRAQLALFSWDFDKTIEYCKEYFPYLNEWYSLNMREESFAMLAFAAIKRGSEKELIEYLDGLKMNFPMDGNERLNETMIRLIEKTVDILNGKTYEAQYIPPEKPMTLSEAIDHLREVTSKKDLSGDTPEDAAYILSRMKKEMDTNEYIGYYEKFADSPKLTERTRVNVIEMYFYLNMPDKAVKAVCDAYKYSWIPVEKTIIMPTSILTYDVNLWSIFTKEMFDYIYTTASIHFRGTV